MFKRIPMNIFTDRFLKCMTERFINGDIRLFVGTHNISIDRVSDTLSNCVAYSTQSITATTDTYCCEYNYQINPNTFELSINRNHNTIRSIHYQTSISQINSQNNQTISYPASIIVNDIITNSQHIEPTISKYSSSKKLYEYSGYIMSQINSRKSFIYLFDNSSTVSSIDIRPISELCLIIERNRANELKQSLPITNPKPERKNKLCIVKLNSKSYENADNRRLNKCIDILRTTDCVIDSIMNVKSNSKHDVGD